MLAEVCGQFYLKGDVQIAKFTLAFMYRETLTFEFHCAAILSAWLYVEFHLSVKGFYHDLASQYCSVQVQLLIFIKVDSLAFERGMVADYKSKVEVSIGASVEPFTPMTSDLDDLPIFHACGNVDSDGFVQHRQCPFVGSIDISELKV